MGPKKEPPEGKGGKDGGQKEKGSKGGTGGGKGKDASPLKDEEVSPEAEEQLPPVEPFCPPTVVTPEFVYNPNLSIEELQDIYALSDISLEDAARKLALILGLEDLVFDARNLILLEYCLGNLMFAKQAGMNLPQALEIYDLGHMVLQLIRVVLISASVSGIVMGPVSMAEDKPFADAERLFKNRLLARSIVPYRTVPPDSVQKENDPPKETKEEDEQKDAQQQKQTKKSKGTEKPKEEKKSKKDKKRTEADKPDEAKKSKKDDKTESDTPAEAEKPEDPKKDDTEVEPLFSHLNVKTITPYFTTTVFQHYCLYQYCFTRVHYNIKRTERVFVETALTCPLSEAKSQAEVEAEEAARAAAEEKAIQDAYAAQWRAEQSLFDSLAAEAKRLAEEELSRKALTLDEYIERAVRHRIEEAKKELIEEYEYRENFLIDKVIQRQKEQEAVAAALAAKNAATAEKTQPSAPPAAAEKEQEKKKEKKKKKGK